MTIKKKLGMGILTGVMGLSLVGGGTWAAFNDVEYKNNSFAAGTLDLDVNDVDGVAATFNLSNLKPGDNMTREFTLVNNGTLAIKDVLMTTTASDFIDGTNEYTTAVAAGGHGMTDNDVNDFLDQFNVEVIDVDRQITVVQNKSLKDLLTMTPNLAPSNSSDPAYSGIPLQPSDSEKIRIKISFKNDTTNKDGNGEYIQNKYQGDSVKVKFSMEASQYQGKEVPTNGEVPGSRLAE
jgi:spore coat-associated protein N